MVLRAVLAVCLLFLGIGAHAAHMGYDTRVTGFRAVDVIGLEVYGSGGEEIGEVEDLVVGRDGMIETLVIEAGGIFDLGDTHFAIPWEETLILQGLDSVRVPVAEEDLPAFSFSGFADQVELGPNSWRITEIADDPVILKNGAKWGSVETILFSPEGRVAGVLTRSDAFSDRIYQISWNDLDINPALDTIELRLSAEQVAELPPFKDAEILKSLEKAPPPIAPAESGSELR